MKLTPVKTLTLASLLAISPPLVMVATSASPAFAASALQTLDPDKDGTVDLNEAKTAASTQKAAGPLSGARHPGWPPGAPPGELIAARPIGPRSPTRG